MAIAAGAGEIRGQALEVSAGWSGPDAPPSWRLTAALFRAIADHDRLLAGWPGCRPIACPRCWPARPSPSSCAATGRSRWPVTSRCRARRSPGSMTASSRPPATSWADRRDDIAAVCAGRRYQMNEVARCTQVALGIAAATASRAGPVSLVDLGSGAGLGLHLDRYRYRVGTGAFGPPEASVRLDCEARGDRQPPPARLPPVAERVGIDVHPVNLGDPDARAWLEACAPPEASALSRLAAAVDVARRHPAAIVAGDAVDALPGVLGGLPRGPAGSSSSTRTWPCSSNRSAGPGWPASWPRRGASAR